MKIIFFGPPGSGKGTQAHLLSQYLNIPHLSTGEILRSKLEEKDDLSKTLKKIMSTGNLVSDEILNKIISKKLLSDDCKKGFIIDGYPRTILQSDYLLFFLNKNLINLNLIVNFNIDNKTVEKRILKRSKTENRSDDSNEVIKTRIKKYNTETKPLLDIYSEKFNNIFHEIDGGQEITKIQLDLKNIIKNGNF